MFKRIINWIIDRVKGPLDAGPYGILMRDPITEKFRPVEREDMIELAAEANLLREEFWSRLEKDAVYQYGARVLREQ